MNKNEFLKKPIVVTIGALICCALWGSAFPAIKIGYKTMGIKASQINHQILYAGIRFFLAGFLTILIGSILQKKILKPQVESSTKILVLSLFQTVGQYIFFYIGLAHTTGVKASIIEGISGFVAIIVSAIIFKTEKLTVNKICGCLLGFSGVIIVNLSGKGLDFSFSLFGEGFLILSTVAYALSSVFLKVFSESENPVVLSGYQFMLGGILMMMYAEVSGAQISDFKSHGILILVYLAFVSAVAYSLWGILLKYNDVSKVVILGFMNPVFGVVLSAILLNEQKVIGIRCLIALILVSLGIYIGGKANDRV
ncbi:DMT family transporter [Lachnobacterium bovis]|uniref:Permease of the drug/metabolite transporter (DMT) superfamily n=1 Tax=Lachnobacterium bovis TaxID=140626 RepID=A0A1H9RUK2_9FIRM|nr:DMT family transporter [Lachnobacterium bovis]SER76327.1 Permease of the drug/metabolite transporter (DMT) superfamily [Lachnobacterium bovis]